MKPINRFCYAFGALALALCLHSNAHADETSAKLSREPLLNKHVTLPSKDIDTHVIRVRFPKGFKTPLHTHEGPGPRYVLKGKLKIEDGGESHSYGPGEVFWETGGEMTVENIGKGEAEMIIFEMVPAKTGTH